MKFIRLAGFIWLWLAFPGGGQGQGTVSLEIEFQSPAGSLEPEMYRKLRMTNPLSIEMTALQPKIGQIIGFFENSGHPFVQVSLDSITPVSSVISGRLLIDPGIRVTIDTLMNRTGFRLSAPVLSRLINIRPGDLYSESALNSAARRLGRISYLKQVRPLEVGFHDGRASIYLFPEKAGSNRFDGWAGLSPDLRVSGRLAFSGALTLKLNNTLGQGEYWLFDWHRNQDGSQKLNLAAHIPYLAGLPFGLQGRFGLYRQDTSYLNLEWDAGIPYYLSPDNQLNLFIRHRESNLLVQTADALNSARQPYEILLSGITWQWDQLDNRINPYRGFQFLIEASTGKKSKGDTVSLQQSEFLADFSWFQPLAKSLTCALILRSGYRLSPETYENEQYRLGGLSLLRGFDEDVFHTDAYAVTSLELRYLLDNSSHLVILADAGFLRSVVNDIPTVNIPAGIGLGGQIRTAGGIFRILFALGKQAGQPVNFRNAKIHLGYVGVF